MVWLGRAERLRQSKMESTALLDLRCQKTSFVEACQSARYLARKVKSARDLLSYTRVKTSLGRRLHRLPKGSNQSCCTHTNIW